jgi:tetratricopeptide (TPR) repeat protein
MTAPPDPLAAALEHFQAGRLSEAEALCKQVLSQSPDNARAYHYLGAIAYRRGDHNSAIHFSQEALNLRPNYPAAHYNLGLALEAQGSYAAAMTCYQRAVEKEPRFAEPQNNLGNLYKKQQQWEQAAASYRRALELRPDFPEALTNQGDVLKELGHYDEAIAYSQRALALRPDFAEAHNNLGSAFYEKGEWQDAASAFEQAIRLKPEYPEAHWNLALLLLLHGDFEQGWREFAWRSQCNFSPPRDCPQPRWNGEVLEGKTILLYAEDGLGDTIQFVRYASLVRRRGANVIVECQKPLKRLLENAHLGEFVPRGAPSQESLACDLDLFEDTHVQLAGTAAPLF